MAHLDDEHLQATLTTALNGVSRTPFASLPLEATIQDVGIDSIGLSNLILDLETALDLEFEESLLLTLSEAETVAAFYASLKDHLVQHAHVA